VAALYAFLARLVGRRAGLYGAIALVTMPLYFMQARTMLGDAVTMAAVTLAFTGLAGALFDAGRARIVWALTAVVGLAAGFLSRGLILGVAAPALSVGATWVVLRAGQEGSKAETGPAAAPSGPIGLLGRLGVQLALVAIAAMGASYAPSRPTVWLAIGAVWLIAFVWLVLRVASERADIRAIDPIGMWVLLLGLAAGGIGWGTLLHAAPDAPLMRVLGVALLKKPPVDATFDLYVRQLGHALFPWSAFLPFAIGRLFRAPPPGQSEAALERETAARIALLVGVSVIWFAYALLGPYTGQLPFAGPALLAGIAAVAIFDLERGAEPSRALALGCAVLAFVLYRDMVLTPEKALSVFSIDKPTFPKSFESDAHLAMVLVTALFAGLVALSWFEAQPAELRRRPLPEQAAEWIGGLRKLAGIWNGNLLFGFVVVEAALVGLGAMLFFGKGFGWSAVGKVPEF